MGKLSSLTLRMRLIITFSIILFLFFLIYGGLLSSSAGNALRKEAEDKADLVVQYLSAANERALLNKDYLSIDIESVKSYPFVEEAFIIDSSYRIIAPTQRRGEEDPRAKDAIEKGIRKVKIGRGLYSVYFPIYKERIELIGIARLDYSISGVEKAISGVKTVRYLFGFFLLFLFVVLFLFLTKYIFSPLYNLRENLEAVLKVEGQFLEETGDPELSPIVSAINRILKRK